MDTYSSQVFMVLCSRETHIYLDSIEEWIQRPRKNIHNVSIMWKVVVLASPLIGNWSVWDVGNGSKIKLGEDP